VSAGLRLEYQPHPAQLAMHEALERNRFAVFAKGRRVGGTLAIEHECIRTGLAGRDRVVLYLAPTYQQTKEAMRDCIRICRGLGTHVRSVHRTDLTIEFQNGSRIIFGSLQRSEFVRGRGADLLCIDEAAFIPEDVYFNALAPMIADRAGRVVFLGSPFGKRGLLWWAWNQAGRGEPGWARLHFPTSANPRIPAAEIAALRAQLPEDAAKQELDGEFLDAASTVFRGVDRCVVPGGFEEPRSGRRFVLAFDPAKSNDWSALVVLDLARLQVVHTSRTRHLDYSTQIDEAIALSRRFNNAVVAVDQSGVGAAVIDSMRRSLGGAQSSLRAPRAGGVESRSVAVQGIVWTAQTKADMVRALQLRIERGRVRIPAAAVELLDELRAYSYVIKGANVTYSAPQGLHDDLVSALLMANHIASDQARAREPVDDPLAPTLAYYVEQIHDYRLRRMLNLAPPRGLRLVTLAEFPIPQSLGPVIRAAQLLHHAGRLSDADLAGVRAELIDRAWKLRGGVDQLRCASDSYLDPLVGSLISFVFPNTNAALAAAQHRGD